MEATMAWLHAQGTPFFQDGIDKLVCQWDKYLSAQRHLVER